MKVVLFGATGMVGQGALIECLRDPAVESVLCVGRRKTGRTHEKLRELVVADVSDASAIGEDLVGHDACLFCLGVSSAGMREEDYRSTRGIRVLYAIFGPLYPLWKRLLPRYVTTTRRLGRAMIRAAAHGAAKRVLETADINALAPDDGS